MVVERPCDLQSSDGTILAHTSHTPNAGPVFDIGGSLFLLQVMEVQEMNTSFIQTLDDNYVIVILQTILTQSVLKTQQILLLLMVVERSAIYSRLMAQYYPHHTPKMVQYLTLVVALFPCYR